MTKATTYCLDANVFIQAWQKYYSPDLCPEYWDILNRLGDAGRIFIPEEVKTEIVVDVAEGEQEDGLSLWMKSCSIAVLRMSSEVTSCWKEILAKDPLHRHLVDSVKGRSLADPWVISHALHRGATVVTKESLITTPTIKRVLIPNVCQNMGVRCIDDFAFVRELGMKFTCSI